MQYSLINILNLIIVVIVIVGAVNWGAVAGLNMDLVKLITPGHADIERYIKIAVGLAGVYYAYLVYTWKTQKYEATTAAPSA